MKFDFSDQDIQQFLMTSGISDISRSLLKAKKERNLVELLGLSSAIETALPEISHQSGLSDYISKLKLLKTSHVMQVWTTPEAYHWTAMTRKLLDNVLHQKPLVGMAKKYVEFLGLTPKDCLLLHLNDFGRFVMGTYLLAKLPLKLDTPVKLRIPNTLPGTGLEINIHESILFIHEKNFSYAGYNGRADPPELPNSFFIGEVDDVSTFEKLGLQVTKMPASDLIVINSFEPCLNLPYIENYPRIHERSRCDRYASLVTRALNRIDKYDSGLGAEIRFLTSSITLMDVADTDAEMCSGTASDIFGAVFLSDTNHELYLAEMLVHEFSHNKLRLLQDVDMLIKPESLGNPSFYSPWRDDPRPLDGLQHGLFVFGNIACFWLNVWKDTDTAQEEQVLAARRLGTLIYQLKFGLEEFEAHARLTEMGELFLMTRKKLIALLEEETHELPFSSMLPLFAGVIRDVSLKDMPINLALSRHRENWETSFRRKQDA